MVRYRAIAVCRPASFSMYRRARLPISSMSCSPAARLRIAAATRSGCPILLASGDGGMAGAWLAATRPDRVGGLVWFQALARSVIAPGWPHGRDARDIDRLAKAAETGWGTAAFVGQL